MMNSKKRSTHPSRREFLQTTTASVAVAALPASAASQVHRPKGPIRIAILADLHHDVMHDGEARLDAFLEWANSFEPDCIMQLGDFAYPSEKNRAVIEKFNKTDGLHVIGNHDTDAGHTKQQCLDVWGMKARYYSHDVHGLRILVLDGNDKGSPTHQGGYVSYVGKEQREWLADQLEKHDGPFLVVSHQALAGPWAVDNAAEMQAVLKPHASKIAMCVNGHNHIDSLRRIDKVHYWSVNSASYQWVGGKFKHESYSPKIHAEHPSLCNTSPYRDSLFAGLTFDPESGTILVEGRESAWVGPSPADLGSDAHADLTNGEEIAARIRSRRIERVRA